MQGRVRPGPTLVVANHVSWIDLLVLAACAPTRPVAKREVCGWPVVGAVARRSGALFVDRDSWRSLPASVTEMTTALRRGHRVQVFPEATTRCGSSLAPFRRAAFQAALDAAVPVSPVTLQYRDTSGRPTAAAAFTGEMTMWESVLRVVRLPGVVVEVHWLPCVPAIPGTGHPATDRRMLARFVQDAVAADLGQGVVHPPGRPAPVLPFGPVVPAPVGLLRAAG
nr:lysophospholipid acyltransferase family protein [Nakamurella flavida]